MHNELSDRQQSIPMRVAGDSVLLISQTLHRSEAWVRKWWQRYLTAGGEGLHELMRARCTVVNRTPMHIISVTIAKITFIRWVPDTGYIDIFGESVEMGRRLRFHYVKVVLETHPLRMKVYCNGRLVKQCTFELRIP